MVKENKMRLTEIGLLPEDWILINLEENFNLKARIGWQGLTTAEYLETGNYGLVTGTDFKNGYIDWDNCVFVEKMRFDQDRNIQLKTGDVLVTKDGTIGKVAYVNFLPKPTTLNSGVFVVRPKLNNINNRFFYYVLMSFYFDDFLLKITAGSTITHLYQKDFVNFNFVCPPSPEQKAIAEALSDADAWIESLMELIAKKRLIKQGTMQELLTPKEGWEVKKLGEIVVINSGYSPSIFTFSEDGIPYLKVDELNNSAKYTVKGSYFIKTESSIKKGSIIFPKRGASIFLNKIRILGEDSFMDTNLMTLTVPENTNNEFLYYSLIFFGLDKIADTTSIPQINNKHILPLEIPYPSLTEQTRIATILSDMDAELEVLEIQLAKARQIKQGMMQELLTGRVRLV
ncbi:restriction endonuclease subunit S [Chryseobacterium sp. MYb328]|uniref:restriction endonuclease subunit S n=1 Tax=Chryseobacterium sp. MYb328 TaxID=2745231 RepID=UPI0030B73E2C